MKVLSDFGVLDNINMMDDNSVSNQNGGMGCGSQQNNSMMNNKQDGQPSNMQRPQYTIPGIMHYIQHEWARFELERSHWEVDRAELEARIAFLQGERKGQENLKNDLVRRIKMLEYALKQERARYHKLKYGVDLQQGDMKPPPPSANDDAPIEIPTDGANESGLFSSVTPVTWRQGRQLLRQYLMEIGFTDTVIDVRSNRVRSLLGVNNGDQDQDINGTGNTSVNSSVNSSVGGGANAESNKRARENHGRQTPSKKTQPGSYAEAMLLDTEAAVMANFEFLQHQDVDMDENEDGSDDVDLDNSDDLDDVKSNTTIKSASADGIKDVDAEAEEVLNELTMMTETEDSNMREMSSNRDWLPSGGLTNTNAGFQSNEVIRRPLGIDENMVDGGLGLGELAQLTVNNDAENTYDITSTGPNAGKAGDPNAVTASGGAGMRKTWNAKYTLRSHFDGVRALAFHPFEPVLITASEDHTLKLWNLQKTVPAKKSASLDVEPLYTFRAHTAPVLCLCITPPGDFCYSAGVDAIVRLWKMPSSTIDPYDSYDPSVLAAEMTGHTDAVWCLRIHHQTKQVLTASADGSVKLWDASPGNQIQTTFVPSESKDAPDNWIPTSADFVLDDVKRVLAAYANGNCIIYETEKGAAVLKFDMSGDVLNTPAAKQINRILCHPSLAVSITAHEDRHIRFWDNLTGKLIHSMVAHLEAVTSLAIDPTGLYLLSGSHDCSIRLWHLENKQCVQEITAHRKKFDESIQDVAFHPSRPFIASAGADGIAKVFI